MFKKNHEKTVRTVGIDISDGSLEVARLIKHADGTTSLQDLHRITLPSQTIVHGLINQHHILRNALLDLLGRSRIDTKRLNVVSALPDTQVIIKHIPLQEIQDTSYEALENFARRAFAQLEFNIENPVFRWMYYHGKPPSLGLYITSRDFIQQWKKFFVKLGVNLISLEMESLAIMRALFRKIPKGSIFGILDFGFRTTSYSIIDAYGLRYSNAIDFGGFHIDTMLTGHLQCSSEEAEHIKRTVGILPETDKKIARMIRDKIDMALNEIGFNRIQLPVSIQHLVITGGGANMPGIAQHISTRLKLPVTCGTLWMYKDKNKIIRLAPKSISSHDQQFYVGAVGLALKSIDRSSLLHGINFVS